MLDYPLASSEAVTLYPHRERKMKFIDRHAITIVGVYVLILILAGGLNVVRALRSVESIRRLGFQDVGFRNVVHPHRRYILIAAGCTNSEVVFLVKDTAKFAIASTDCRSIHVGREYKFDFPNNKFRRIG